MNKYLGIYSTSGDVQTAINNGELNKPYVAIVSGNLDYNTVENQPDYSQIPLTFEILSDGNISWLSKFDVDVTIEYSKNGGAWTSITSSNSGGGDDSTSSPSSSGSGGGGTTGTLIPVVTGDIVQFRGTDHLNGNATFQTTTAQINVYGNINSLITTGYATNPESVVLSTNEYNSLFAVGAGASFPAVNVISAENLVLPATTLADYCYSYMFEGCTNLTTAPQLPATTLADSCYKYMFRDCTSLTTAPSILPATALTEGCYYMMFNGCTSLTTAPELPATTLANSCYNNMFYGCTSLTTAPQLPATTLARYCYNGMFVECTSLTTAPELPATTLKNYCYQNMFNGCTSLNYIKCLATNISASDCINVWVYNVASSGTFVKASSMTDWTRGSNGIPSGWTVVEE